MRRRTALWLLLLVAAACAVNPATGRREIMLVSESQEVQLGRESDPAVTAQYGLVDDPELQRYVSDLGHRLAAVSERPDLPWSFKVVDDPIVNAFALPGGFIYVTRGILARFDSEAELAGVLGHEIGHVTARHGASQMTRQQLQMLGLGVGMIVSERFREYGGLAMQGLQLLNLSYSRGDESEADRLGLRYMSRLGYDADAMIGVFQMLEQVSGASGSSLPEWQMTHPLPENREAAIRDEIAATGVSREGTVNRDPYIRRLDGLVYGEDPRQGYFEGQRFLHPDMAFELTFPTGWSTVNQRTIVGAVSPSEDAVVVLGVQEAGDEPAAALRAFLAGDGISGGSISQSNSGNVSMARADFQATSDDGSVSGTAAFARLGDVTYRMLGYASPAQWASYRGSVDATIRSFDEVSDPQVLGVQPLRLRIVQLSSASSLTSWVRTNPQPLELEALGAINRVAPNAVISAGALVKTVVGTPIG